MVNKQKFKYLLFDWDGTLLNSLPSWIAGIREALRKYRLDTISDRDIARNILNDLEMAYKIYPQLIPLEFRDYVYQSDYVLNLHLSPLHDEVTDVLKFMRKKNIPMGIVTTSFRKQLSDSLSHHKLDRYFDIMICRDDVTNRKPHPEPVLKGIDKLKAVASSTLYVGDSQHDTGAGRAAKLKTAIHYPRTASLFYDEDFIKQANPDYIFRRLKELHTLV